MNWQRFGNSAQNQQNNQIWPQFQWRNPCSQVQRMQSNQRGLINYPMLQRNNQQQFFMNSLQPGGLNYPVHQLNSQQQFLLNFPTSGGGLSRNPPNKMNFCGQYLNFNNCLPTNSNNIVANKRNDKHTSPKSNYNKHSSPKSNLSPRIMSMNKHNMPERTSEASFENSKAKSTQAEIKTSQDEITKNYSNIPSPSPVVNPSTGNFDKQNSSSQCPPSRTYSNSNKKHDAQIGSANPSLTSPDKHCDNLDDSVSEMVKKTEKINFTETNKEKGIRGSRIEVLSSNLTSPLSKSSQSVCDNKVSGNFPICVTPSKARKFVGKKSPTTREPVLKPVTLVQSTKSTTSFCNASKSPFTQSFSNPDYSGCTTCTSWTNSSVTNPVFTFSATGGESRNSGLPFGVNTSKPVKVVIDSSKNLSINSNVSPTVSPPLLNESNGNKIPIISSFSTQTEMTSSMSKNDTGVATVHNDCQIRKPVVQYLTGIKPSARATSLITCNKTTNKDKQHITHKNNEQNKSNSVKEVLSSIPLPDENVGPKINLGFTSQTQNNSTNLSVNDPHSGFFSVKENSANLNCGMRKVTNAQKKVSGVKGDNTFVPLLKCNVSPDSVTGQKQNNSQNLGTEELYIKQNQDIEVKEDVASIPLPNDDIRQSTNNTQKQDSANMSTQEQFSKLDLSSLKDRSLDLDYGIRKNITSRPDEINSALLFTRKRYGNTHTPTSTIKQIHRLTHTVTDEKPSVSSESLYASTIAERDKKEDLGNITGSGLLPRQTHIQQADVTGGSVALFFVSSSMARNSSADTEEKTAHFISACGTEDEIETLDDSLLEMALESSQNNSEEESCEQPMECDSDLLASCSDNDKDDDNVPTSTTKERKSSPKSSIKEIGKHLTSASSNVFSNIIKDIPLESRVRKYRNDLGDVNCPNIKSKYKPGGDVCREKRTSEFVKQPVVVLERLKDIFSKIPKTGLISVKEGQTKKYQELLSGNSAVTRRTRNDGEPEQHNSSQSRESTLNPSPRRNSSNVRITEKNDDQQKSSTKSPSQTNSSVSLKRINSSQLAKMTKEGELTASNVDDSQMGGPLHRNVSNDAATKETSENNSSKSLPLFSKNKILELREKLTPATVVPVRKSKNESSATEENSGNGSSVTETASQKSPLLLSKNKLHALNQKLIKSKKIQTMIRPKSSSSLVKRRLESSEINASEGDNISLPDDEDEDRIDALCDDFEMGVSDVPVDDDVSCDTILAQIDACLDTDHNYDQSQADTVSQNEPNNIKSSATHDEEIKPSSVPEDDEVSKTQGSGSISSDEESIPHTKRCSKYKPDFMDSDEDDIVSSGSSYEDDELVVMDLLGQFREASTRPIPSTPDNLSQNFLDDSLNISSQESGQHLAENSEIISSKLCLRNMLTEFKIMEKEMTEHERLHAELKSDILKGGFVKLAEETNTDAGEDDLEPDQKRQLDEIKIRESEIKNVNPGLEIFSEASFKRLFSETISPGACGFVPGDSRMDQLIGKLTPDQYDVFITSDILDLCYKNVSDMDSIFRWFFFQMSVHSNTQVSHTCKSCIEEIIFKQSYVQNVLKTWSPTVRDVLQVFLNFGGNPCQLLPDFSLVDSYVMRNILVPLETENIENLQPVENALNRYNRENLRMVLQTLMFIFHHRPKYSATEMTALIIILLRSSLDKSLNLFWLSSDYQLCIAAALDCYQECDWLPQVEIICDVLSSHTVHHHDKLHMVELLPSGPRGSYLQTRLSYCMLLKTLDAPKSCSSLETFQIKHLHILIPKLRRFIQEHQFYLLHNIVMMIDLSVADENAKQHDKGNLTILTDSMKKVASLIKEDVRFLDRSKVKDLIVRLTSKWSLMMMKMGSKQMSLYSWTTRQSPHKVEVERVKASQNDKETDESETEDLDLTDPIESMDVDSAKNQVQLKDGEQSPPISVVAIDCNQNDQNSVPCILADIKVKVEKPWDDYERTPTKLSTFQNSYNISSTLKKLSNSQKKEEDVICVYDSDNSLPEI